MHRPWYIPLQSDKIFPHIKKEDLILDLLEDSEAEAKDSCSDISINSEERGTVLLQMLTDLYLPADGLRNTRLPVQKMKGSRKLLNKKDHKKRTG